MDNQTSKKPVLGISSCLLGEKVRFDSGHKKHGYITKTLSQYFEFKSHCPEMAAGMGVPRPTIHLASDHASDDFERLRLVNTKDHGIEHTENFLAACEDTTQWLGDLSGYILKKGSPSCGLERVKVFPFSSGNPNPQHDGVGLFAAFVKQQCPLLPMEEEGRLNDAPLRETFIERVYIYHAWRELSLDEQGNVAALTPKKLFDFHAQHKFNLLCHNQRTYRELGKLIAGVNKYNIDDVAQVYIAAFMQAINKPAKKGDHVNVLQHIQGFLRPKLESDEKQTLTDSFEQYLQGNIPRIVPIMMLKHFFKRHPNPYIEQCFYLRHFPADMKLSCY